MRYEDFQNGGLKVLTLASQVNSKFDTDAGHLCHLHVKISLGLFKKSHRPTSCRDHSRPTSRADVIMVSKQH